MDCQIILSDCVEGMSKLADGSVDLSVSSPPYYVEKDYEKGITRIAFQCLLDDVFSQIHRLLKPGGYFVVNFGDCFNSGNRWYESDVPSVYPMTVFYWDTARKYNFDLQATRIWRKKFAKLAIPFVCNSHPRPVFDYEHIWTFRKKNGSNVEFVNDRKLSQRGVLGEDWTSPAKLDIHCAAFPVELPAWAINVYSKEGDLVMDPFSGSGTTALAARTLKRRFIGFERDKGYYDYSIDRLAKSAIEF